MVDETTDSTSLGQQAADRPKKRNGGRVGAVALVGVVLLGGGALTAAAVTTGDSQNTSPAPDTAIEAVPAQPAASTDLEGAENVAAGTSGTGTKGFGKAGDLPQSGATDRGVGDGRPLSDDDPKRLPLVPEAEAIPPAALSKKIAAHFPKTQVGHAMAVARTESGMRSTIGKANPDGTRDWGIFQLNDGGTLQSALTAIGEKPKSMLHARTLALDPDINIRAAAWIFKKRGWAPWVGAHKAGIVAKLYTNQHGPMWDRFDRLGLPKPEEKPTPSTSEKPKE